MALFKRHEFSQNSITEGVIWKNLLAFFFPSCSEPSSSSCITLPMP